MGNKILAIHAGKDRLCWATAESSIRSLTVENVAEAPFGADGMTRELLPEGQWDRVVCSVAADVAVYRFLDLPFQDRGRVNQAVGAALEEHVPLNLDDCAVAWDFTAEDRKGLILAAMARRDDLEQINALWTSIGLRPQRLVWSPMATMELYRRTVDGGVFTAIDVSSDGTTMGLFDNGRLVDLRTLGPCSEGTLLKNIAWCFRSMNPPSKRVVIGGIPLSPAADEGLSVRLQDTLPGCELEGLPAQCPLTLREELTTPWRQYATLMGLVYAATSDGGVPDIDFAAGLRGDLEGGLLTEMRPLLPWGAVALASLLLSGGLEHFSLYRRWNSLLSRTRAVYSEVMPDSGGSGGYKLKMQMRYDALLSKGAGSGSDRRLYSPLGVLSLLSATIPPEIEVEFDNFVQVSPTVRITGSGSSFEAIDKLQQSLQDSGHFPAVEVRDVRAAVDGEGVDFQLILSLAAGGGKST